MCADIPNTLPPFLYFLVRPSQLHPVCTQAGLFQLKLTSGYTKFNIRRIRFISGELQRIQPFNILPNGGVDIKLSSGSVPVYTYINGTPHLIYGINQLYPTKYPWTQIYLYSKTLNLVLFLQRIVLIWIKEILLNNY